MKRDIEAVLPYLRNAAQNLFPPSGAAHDWQHTLRVRNLCMKIGRLENADLAILECAALFHDCCRVEQDKSRGAVCHASLGAESTGKLLRSLHIHLHQVEAVTHCILAHRFRTGPAPESLEARILYDCDKIDSIGATGIGRAFYFAARCNAPVHISSQDIEKSEEYSPQDTAFREFSVKLRHIRDLLYTESARSMAAARHDFMENFFIQLDNETRGLA